MGVSAKIMVDWEAGQGCYAAGNRIIKWTGRHMWRTAQGREGQDWGRLGMLGMLGLEGIMDGLEGLEAWRISLTLNWAGIACITVALVSSSSICS